MEHILPFAAEYDLLPKDGLLLVALSGGGDSVALLHFLKTHGFQVVAAHFNHHLRDTARRDAEFCRDLCKDWGVPFLTWGARVGEMPGNTEANARQARYAYLHHLAAGLHAARIVTAHTASDNLETLLLHLARGCGLQGLTGIQPRRGILVRPMLHTTRRGVEGYLEEHHLPFVTDETNLDDRFSRNRIRHQVVPVLEALNPKAVDAAARLMDALREDEAFLSSLGRGMAEKARSWDELEDLPPALRYRAQKVWAEGRQEDGIIPWLSPGQTLPVPLGEAVDTPLYTLLAREVDAAPDVPPTPSHFYLRPWGPMGLRARQTGDFLHPPHRTGKTVKKWMNELKVPKNRREAMPVLIFGEELLAVAGLGPQEKYLARPGEAAVEVIWTAKEQIKSG